MTKTDRIRVLIADDHKLVREGIKILLDGAQDIFVAGESCNGAEVIEFVKQTEVDVVLMDIDMPVMNGIEATRNLLANFPQIAVIGLSMHNNKNTVEKIMNAGARGYILKNTDSASLVFAIRNISQGFNFIDKGIIPVKKSEQMIFLDTNPVPLSGRETQVLTLIAEGFSNKEISEKLFISPKTVDTHRTALMKKLDIHNVAGLVRYAISKGIIGT